MRVKFNEDNLVVHEWYVIKVKGEEVVAEFQGVRGRFGGQKPKARRFYFRIVDPMRSVHVSSRNIIKVHEPETTTYGTAW
jgi:hypothetical protein